jgi:arginase
VLETPHVDTSAASTSSAQQHHIHRDTRSRGIERARIVDAGAHCIFGGQDGIDYAAQLRHRLRAQGVEKRSVVHIDLDSLDPKVGHANDYPVPGGLLAHDLLGILDALATCQPTSLTVASFDPDLENGARIVDLAVEGITDFMKGMF